MQIASEGLKGRVFECNLADLQSVSLHPAALPVVTIIEVLPTTEQCSHIIPVSLQNEADAYRKIRLRAEDVQGRNVLTNFWVSTASSTSQFVACLCPCPAALVQNQLAMLSNPARCGGLKHDVLSCRAWTSRQTSCGRWCASGRR